MIKNEAYDILELPRGRPHGAATIKAAALVLMRKAHPDTGGEEAHPEKVATIKKARDYLLSLEKKSSIACRACNGSGRIRASFGHTTCAQCGGHGEKESA